MFSSSFYDKLDPTYREALLKLENDLLNANKESHENFKIIQAFAANYFTPRIIWLKIWKYRPTILYPAVLYHFAYSEDMKQDCGIGRVYPTRKLMNRIESVYQENFFPDIVHLDEDALCFPHNMMNLSLFYYESEYAQSHLPQKILKRHFEMRKLYEKIKAVEKENEEEWINAMKEAEDNEFVKHNIEFKLGQDSTNKKLWILYIEYLKEYDVQELLQVYSKYCRLFVDDITMKEEYKQAAEKYGKPTVPWKNAFDFEIYDESLLKIDYTQPHKKRLKCPVYFNSQNIVSQWFPFHANLMDYIVKNAKSNILQKLNFSCKYFFNKYRIPVCHDLTIWCSLGDPHAFGEESLSIYSYPFEEMILNNLNVSTKLWYRCSPEAPLSRLIPKLNRCDAKYIEITNQELTFVELKFFIGHGNVISLEFSNVIITDADGKRVPLEEILALTPKLQSLGIDNAHYSANFSQRLCELPFENKFFKFGFRNNEKIEIDPYALGEFINKHALPYCKITFDVNDGSCEEIVKSIIDGFWKTDPKPCVNRYFVGDN